MAILTQMDLDNALLGNKRIPAGWTNDKKERVHKKAVLQIKLHISNEIL